MSIKLPDDDTEPSPGLSPVPAIAHFTTLFRHIPPERIGLQGEYDYYGLSKRARAALHDAFSSEEIRHIKVYQRGAMIVLLGTVPNRGLLSRMAQVVMSVEGAVGVEFNGVSVIPPYVDRPWNDHFVWQASHQPG